MDTPNLMYYLVKNSEMQMASPAKANPAAISLQAPDLPDGVTNDESRAPLHDLNNGPGTLEIEERGGPGDNPAQRLRQQQSVISSNVVKYAAHKDNPVYHLVKKSMKDAKFPERKYRKLKEELRSTCEKCTKKEQ